MIPYKNPDTKALSVNPGKKAPPLEKINIPKISAIAAATPAV